MTDHHRLRLTILGSSISIQKSGYLPLMIDRLKAMGCEVELLNASLGGCKTEATIAYLAANLFYDIDAFSPTHIIIEKGANERCDLFSKADLKTQAKIERRIYTDTRELVLRSIQLGAVPILMSSYFKENANNKHAAEEPAGYISRAYRKVENEFGILHIDAANRIKGLVNNGLTIDEALLDDVHLAPRGAEIVAEYAAEEIRKYLTLINGSPGINCKTQSTKTMTITKPDIPNTASFETKLVKTEYFRLDLYSDCLLRVPKASKDSPCIITGIFLISGPDSGWLRIESDLYGHRDVCFFDHMSFYERIHYISINPPLPVLREVLLKAIDGKIAVEKAINTYENSKTFDPSEDWAKKKYLNPLLSWQSANELRGCKIIALVGEELQDLKKVSENSTSFYESSENIFGLEESSHGLLTMDGARVVGGVGEMKNSHVITDSDFHLLPEYATENVIWMEKCIHRIKGAQPQKLEAARRLSLLQYEVMLQSASSVSRQGITMIEGPSIWLAHAFGWYAYGHLFDTLQRLYYLQEMLDGLGSFNILISRPHRIRDFEVHLKCLLGHDAFNRATIIELKKGAHYSVERLIYSQCPATLTSFTNTTCEWVNKQYMKFFSQGRRSGNKLKLYLSRNHIRPGMRGVLNEFDVIETLTEYGFTIIDGSEDLETIYRHFSSASLVVGPHGSLFANTVFCPEDAIIIEFCPANRRDSTFARKHKPCAQYFQCITNGDSQFNISIDLDIIKDFL